MDLASPDETYRRFSLTETQRVIDITRSLKKFFPKTQRPMIVANVGGFSMDAPLPAVEKQSYYERFAASLEDDLGCGLIPDHGTLPLAFWWATLSNLFVQLSEIQGGVHGSTCACAMM